MPTGVISPEVAGGPVPALLVAETVTRYAVPFVRPVTVADVAVLPTDFDDLTVVPISARAT